MTFLLERIGLLTCELCAQPTTQLYPLTRHNGKHFVPVKACLACCGPASSETYGSVALPRRVILGESDE